MKIERRQPTRAELASITSRRPVVRKISKEEVSRRALKDYPTNRQNRDKRGG